MSDRVHARAFRAQARRSRAWAVGRALRTLRGPISDKYGFDRGTPIDRPYIEMFLRQHEHDVRGRVLEVKNDDYARRFGGDRLAHVEVIDVDPANSVATLIGDLDESGVLPRQAFDCILLTQVLQFLDPTTALPNLYESLVPGGVLLLTTGCLCRQEDADRDYWRLPPAGLRRLLEQCLPSGAQLTVEGRGNAVSAAAFTLGLAAEELGLAHLEPVDWRFPVVSLARVVRGTSS